MRVRGYVSTCFGCPYEGRVDPEVVLRVTRDLFALGVQEVSLGDTIGVAVPTEVTSMVERLRATFDLDTIALHFHDTRGTALANVAERMGVAGHSVSCVRLFSRTPAALSPNAPFAHRDILPRHPHPPRRCAGGSRCTVSHFALGARRRRLASTDA